MSHDLCIGIFSVHELSCGVEGVKVGCKTLHGCGSNYLIKASFFVPYLYRFLSWSFSLSEIKGCSYMKCLQLSSALLHVRQLSETCLDFWMYVSLLQQVGIWADHSPLGDLLNPGDLEKPLHNLFRQLFLCAASHLNFIISCVCVLDIG